MNSPKQLLHKDKDRLEKVAEYVANPMFEQVLSLAFAEYAFGLDPQQQPAVNDLKRQGAKEAIRTALILGTVAKAPERPEAPTLGPLPGDPGYEEFAKKFLNKK
jgi:hypothetical protein